MPNILFYVYSTLRWIIEIKGEIVKRKSRKLLENQKETQYNHAVLIIMLLKHIFLSALNISSKGNDETTRFHEITQSVILCEAKYLKPRFFTEPALSETLRFFAPLRMTRAKGSDDISCENLWLNYVFFSILRVLRGLHFPMI